MEDKTAPDNPVVSFSNFKPFYWGVWRTGCDTDFTFRGDMKFFKVLLLLITIVIIIIIIIIIINVIVIITIIIGCSLLTLILL